MVFRHSSRTVTKIHPILPVLEKQQTPETSQLFKPEHRVPDSMRDLSKESGRERTEETLNLTSGLHMHTRRQALLSRKCANMHTPQTYTKNKTNSITYVLKDTCHVRTDSRYGIKTLFPFACSESADMTFPRVSKDLLMLTPSCSTVKNSYFS